MERNKRNKYLSLAFVTASLLAGCTSEVAKPNIEQAITPVSTIDYSLFLPLPKQTSTLVPTLTSTATSTPEPTPTVTLTPKPTSTPTIEKSNNVFDLTMDRLATEAVIRRQARPTEGIDLELSKENVNFLLFSYGQTFEPPFKEVNIIGSATLYSYNLRSREISAIALTHDIRAPEIERFKSPTNQKVIHPIKIDQAYLTGGFTLQRQIWQDATGLPIDYQIAFGEGAIVDLVDNVFGTIPIQNQKEFQVNPFYYNSKQYPGGTFPKGSQRLNGLDVLKYIKTIVIETGKPDPQLEHNIRKSVVIDGVLQGIKENSYNPLFWGKMIGFIRNSSTTKEIDYDFDPISLGVNNIGGVGWDTISSSLSGNDMSFKAKLGNTLYIVDKTQGAGGVGWVKGNPYKKTQDDLSNYTDQNMEVPYNSDPYADNLVTSYWQSVRSLVKSFLLGK